MRRTLITAIGAGLAMACAGCGYSTRSLVSTQYRTIYIAPFANTIDITQESDSSSRYKVYKPKLETDVTKSVINKFLTDGNLKPVSGENADVVLRGELVEFRRDPVRYTDSDDVLEYRLNIVVNLAFRDRKDDRLLWEEKRFTGDATYFTSGALAKSEDTATAEAVKDLSRRIVERVVEQW
ncbi:MAG: LptE family protein [Candidatus Omnitrophica bacterium]|nr:LptE family protein [Candidatus Omnitrophota bacterium]